MKHISVGTRLGTLPKGLWPTRITRYCPKLLRNGRSSGLNGCCRVILEIIYEINRRLIDEVRRRFPGDEGRVQRVSLVEEGAERKIRMANLAIVGSHSTNGVAAIHSQLLRTMTVKDLAEMFPQRFSNKTNGVTPRRWLLMSNPALSQTITDAIGDGWVTDLSQLKKLKPLADDQGLRQAFLKAKRQAKLHFIDWLKRTTGQNVDADSIFDCQIKRIHEYKRQLLNALRIVVLYNRLRKNPNSRDDAANFLLRRQGGTRLSTGQGNYQVHQQSRQILSTGIRSSGDGSRFCSCPTTVFQWQSG